jgi:hypothetical protein
MLAVPLRRARQFRRVTLAETRPPAAGIVGPDIPITGIHTGLRLHMALRGDAQGRRDAGQQHQRRDN